MRFVTHYILKYTTEKQPLTRLLLVGLTESDVDVVKEVMDGLKSISQRSLDMIYKQALGSKYSQLLMLTSQACSHHLLGTW